MNVIGTLSEQLLMWSVDGVPTECKPQFAQQKFSAFLFCCQNLLFTWHHQQQNARQIAICAHCLLHTNYLQYLRCNPDILCHIFDLSLRNSNSRFKQHNKKTGHFHLHSVMRGRICWNHHFFPSRMPTQNKKIAVPHALQWLLKHLLYINQKQHSSTSKWEIPPNTHQAT